MLTLLSLPAGLGLPSASPFCVKAMVLLHLAQVDWEVEYVAMPRGMPYDRLPVLRDETGGLVPDSGNIQAFLANRGAPLWNGVSGEGRQRGHMMIRLAEESLRYGLLHDRWLVPACWDVVGPAFFGDLPAPMRWIVPGAVRRSVRRMLMSNGIAQFNEQDRIARMEADLDAVQGHLWETPYLLGQVPTAADAAVAPVLAMIAALPAQTALRDAVRSRPQILSYVDRMGPLMSLPIEGALPIPGAATG